MKQRMILCTVVSILLCTILTACGEEQIPSAPEPIRITVMVDTKAELPWISYLVKKYAIHCFCARQRSKNFRIWFI